MRILMQVSNHIDCMITYCQTSRYNGVFQTGSNYRGIFLKDLKRK